MPAWFIAFGRVASVFVVLLIIVVFTAIAAVPAFAAIDWVSSWWAPDNRMLASFWTMMSIGVGYIVWGLSGCALTVFIKRFVLFYYPKPGGFPMFSFPIIGWGLTSLLHRWMCTTFLFLLLGTPLLCLYFRGLGARIGHRVNINTLTLWDWDMLTIEDDAILGGESVIQGHLVDGGRINMDRVIIGKMATVGSRSSVMPGCSVGDRSTLAANAVMKKLDQIPADEIWGGIPAKFLKARSQRFDTGVKGQ
jgi:non-ribosomal peptide synthetase-like protein